MAMEELSSDAEVIRNRAQPHQESKIQERHAPVQNALSAF